MNLESVPSNHKTPERTSLKKFTEENLEAGEVVLVHIHDAKVFKFRRDGLHPETILISRDGKEGKYTLHLPKDFSQPIAEVDVPLELEVFDSKDLQIKTLRTEPVTHIEHVSNW